MPKSRRIARKARTLRALRPLSAPRRSPYARFAAANVEKRCRSRRRSSCFSASIGCTIQSVGRMSSRYTRSDCLGRRGHDTSLPFGWNSWTCFQQKDCPSRTRWSGVTLSSNPDASVMRRIGPRYCFRVTKAAVSSDTRAWAGSKAITGRPRGESSTLRPFARAGIDLAGSNRFSIRRGIPSTKISALGWRHASPRSARTNAPASSVQRPSPNSSRTALAVRPAAELDLPPA